MNYIKFARCITYCLKKIFLIKYSWKLWTLAETLKPLPSYRCSHVVAECARIYIVESE